MTRDEQKLILIAGSGRSGTSWLQSIIGAPLNYRLVFEPFHPHISQRQDFVRLYLNAESRHDELYVYLRSVLDGGVRNRWMMQGGHAHRWYFFRNRFWASDIVVKVIRGNMMLEWLQRNFGCRILFIIRHPCAVVASWRKMGWDRTAEWNFDFVRSQESLINEHFEDCREFIFMTNPTPIQWMTMLWCMENKIALQQCRKNNWTGVSYENLVCDAKSELDRLYTKLHLPKPWTSYRALDQVLPITWQRNYHASMLTHWQHELSEEDIQQVFEILDAFDMEFYTREPHPNDELQKFLNM